MEQRADRVAAEAAAVSDRREGIRPDRGMLVLGMEANRVGLFQVVEVVERVPLAQFQPITLMAESEVLASLTQLPALLYIMAEVVALQPIPLTRLAQAAMAAAVMRHPGQTAGTVRTAEEVGEEERQMDTRAGMAEKELLLCVIFYDWMRFA